jgi:hypothetical protein
MIYASHVLQKYVQLFDSSGNAIFDETPTVTNGKLFEFVVWKLRITP